ncbi:DUF58 domain-containing protein [Candidatus Cyanaurora vandensis]|uniref:DUF58 domain-containing protein n=1 Tax=Candidatus Cyanaurora vandensis TaxID=2714958 RepID=UPI002580E019|nr:DUF58 domain-containing protein [Candidatus Cyanaurora vandensis]
MPRLTRQGLGLLALGLVWALADFGVPGLGWAVLGWDILVLGIIYWDYQQIQPQRLNLVRQFSPRLALGQPNLVQLELTNLTSRALTYELVELIAWDLPMEPRTLTGELVPGVNQLTYTLRPNRRGTYPVPPAQVRVLSPWGLSWRSGTVGTSTSFTVYPDLVTLKKLSLRLTQQSDLLTRRRNRRGISTEFADLREYGVGDDPRFIDWKATARRGQPIVRTFQEERDQTLLVLLDGGRMMFSEVAGLRKYDWALNAALALVLTGIRQGDRVGLGVFDRSLRVWVPPRSGAGQLEAVLQRVHDTEPQLVEPDYTGAIAQVLVRNPRRALVVVLTDLIDPQASSELLKALAKLAPRHLPFCVTFQDPLVAESAARVARTTREVYQQAVALQLIRQRAEAFRVLQSRGALVLDSPAPALSTRLVNAYLQVKARNQL